MAEQIQIDTSGFTGKIEPVTSIDTSGFTGKINTDKPQINKSTTIDNQIDTSGFTDKIKQLETDSSTQLSTSDTFTNYEKIRYGIDKQNQFFGNLYRITKAGVQALFDPDNEFKDYVEQNYEQEQKKLKQKYGELASGKYDNDALVQAASLATFMVDPFYLFAYLSPWGRAATASYKGLATVSGLTVGLDTAISQLATTGEIDPTKVGLSTATAATLGPLSVKAFRSLSKLFPGAKKEELANVIKVIEGQKAKQIGVSKSQFQKLQKIAGDEEIINLNKQINLKISKEIAPIQKLDESINAVEKRIENKINKLLIDKKDIKGKGSVKKKLAVQSKIDNQNKILNVRKAEYDKAKKSFWEKISKKDREIIDLQSKREFTTLKLLKQNQSLARNTAEFVIGASLRPAFGAGAGYAFGRLWGKEDQELRNWMLVGASLGATQKLIQRSGKVFSTGEKNMLDKVIFNEATKNAFQKARVLLSTTSATKLKAYGGETEKIGLKLFQNLDGPVSQNSASGVADRIRREYTQKAFEISQKLNSAEEAAAIRIVRGSKEKGNQKVNTAAKEIQKWLDDFRNEYTKVGLGLRKVITTTTTNKKGVTKTIQKEVRIDPIKDYFPRVWNWNVVKQDPNKFKDVITKILKDVNPKLTDKEAKATAETFYNGIQKSSADGVYDKQLVSKLITSVMAGDKTTKTISPIIKNLPLDEHITKDRVLNGSYAKVEKVLEKNGYLVNDINSTLNNLVTRSADSIGFASQFGNKGQLLKPYIQGIVEKYKGNPKQLELANKEISLVFDHVDAFFGRYGKIRENVARTSAGILSTLSNLNMLERVSIASLGDLVQVFSNSNNFKAALAGLARTGFRAKDESSLATQLGYNQGKVLENQLLKTLTPLDKNPTLAANAMDNPGILRKTNELGFKVLGLQWVTGFARRFAYNTGAVDALVSSQKLAKFVANGNSVRSAKGLRLLEKVERYGLTLNNALRLGTFETIENAAKQKFARNLLNKAGITAANRDALIPQVSNRLIFTQSRDPLTRLLGQFLSWTLAKSAQTNKLLTRIENGDAKQLVKLLAALPVYGGIQELREVAKYGEVVTDRETETDKWYSEALRLSGLTGTLPELFIGRLTGPGSREPWFLFAPSFSILTEGGQVAKDVADKNYDSALNRFLQRIAPAPIFTKWIRSLFTDEDVVTPVKSPLNNFRQNFNKGDVVVPLKKPSEEDMNKKDVATVASAAIIASAIGANEMNKAVENKIIPPKKPDVVVEKDYSNVSTLEPNKKSWLLNTAEKVYKTNKDNIIPNDIILAINSEETGWGTSRFVKDGSNNLFNIQVFDKNKPHIKARGSDAMIKKYPTEEDSIKDFLNMVANSEKYQGVRNTINAFNEGKASKADIIKAIANTGYAENKNWSSNVTGILNRRIDGKNKEELKGLYNKLFVDKE